MTALGAAPHSVARRRASRTVRAAASHPGTRDAPPAGFIARDALVSRLSAIAGGSVALLVAPVGYGKSALLSQWAAADGRPFAAVRLCPADDDPAELVRTLAGGLAALDAPLRAALAEAQASRGRRATAKLERALARALSEPDHRCVLVLDDVQVLRDPDASRTLARLVERLGSGPALALASRCELDLPVARLRAERRLVELRVPDLTLSHAEISRFASAAGLDVDEAGVELLAARTEGWAAGLYLAGLAVGDRSKTLRALSRFGGDDRVVADYIREEVLAGLSPELTTFLIRTSILARLSGEVCDHVLDRRNSARMLRQLSRMNVLLVPLDRTDTEYRYHPLLAQALRSELRRLDGELETKLHARASQWYEQAGNRELAIDHAIDAGDVDRAGHLLWSEAPSLLGYGHCDKLIGHLRRFSREQLQACAPLALTAASAQLAAGDRALVEHWTAAAMRQLDPGTPNSSLESGLLVMRAAVSDAGLAAARDDAARAYALAGEASPWRSLACLVEGAARQLAGDRDGARALLEEGARRGAALAPAIQVLCLGQLALLAIDDDEWDAADVLTARAHAQIGRVRIGDYPTAALVFAVSAAVHAHFGRLDACDRDVRQANRLLGELGGFTPWFTAECRIALAWAALRLSDQRTARQLLEQASYELRLVPEASVAHAWLDACRQQLDYVAGARSTDAEPLTKAELRVLQFLPTHLSFLEIAEHLYVSTNTVKTHARAVYRKLAASSRSEAVLHARQAGLLEGSA